MAPRMARMTRAVWKKRVERWERSGQSAARFAARINVNPYTLKWWKWALGTEQARPAGAASTIEAAQFVELVHGGGQPAPDETAGPSVGREQDEGEGRVEVRLPAGVRVFLPARFDVNAIAGLVAAFERR
jgi:hypothetical protein